tara:strand:- start:8519 stop:9526 length:1008 start_codon:yes stop_codon:yes gene_type:complete
MKKVLITGITGMVGSHLADYLLKNTNWYIFGLCRWRSPLDNINHLIDRVNRKDRIEFLYGDLCDPYSIDDAILQSQPDYIFHLAAQSYPKTSFTSPIETLNTNILGTLRLLESVKKNKFNPLIHVCSSSEVFGRVTKDKIPIDENCNFHPASPYAISKVGTDLVGKYYSEAFGLKVLTTRMFTHTGPRRGDVFAESSFAKQIALIENKKIEPIVKVGNVNSLRTIADVRDAVEAYYLLLTVNPIPGEVYNIGGEYTCKIEDVLNTLIDLSSEKDIKISVEKNRLRPIDADLQVPNTKKFRDHTGWEPKIPYEKTMKDLLNYWRNRIKNNNDILVR